MLSRLKQKRVPSVSLTDASNGDDGGRGRETSLSPDKAAASSSFSNGNGRNGKRSASRSSRRSSVHAPSSDDSKGALLVPISADEYPSDSEELSPPVAPAGGPATTAAGPSEGSLSLDHLDAALGNSGKRTPVVQAPELLFVTSTDQAGPAPPSSTAPASFESESSMPTPTAEAYNRFDLPPVAASQSAAAPRSPQLTPVKSRNTVSLLSPSSAASSLTRSRSNTIDNNAGPSPATATIARPDMSGLQALADINRSTTAASAIDDSAHHAGNPPSRPMSRTTSFNRKRGTTSASDPNGAVDESPSATTSRKSTLSVPISPNLRKTRSNTGIAAALAASGVSLAASNPAARPSLSRAAGRDSTDDERSEYDPLDTMSEFDDVVSMLGTGYAVASSKRNAEFHNIFKNIPEDDYLIEDYGCALQRDILVQGRLYISEHHLCFNANIFGWVTSLTLPFAEVVSIEKRMTAYVIPNAIQVITLHARYTFASFLSRDTTYDLICNIWRMVHPGIPPAAALPDSTSRVDLSAAQDADESLSTDAGAGQEEAEPSGKGVKKRLLGRRKRGDTATSDSSNPGIAAGKESAAPGATANGAVIANGTSTTGTKATAHVKLHPETTDTCPILQNLKEVCMDAVFPSTPEKIYNLMFTSGFMKEFWQNDQKLTDIEMSDWAPQKTGSHLLTRSMTYIKQLNNSIGPKQTKCHLTDENAHVDFDDFVCVVTTTRTPDVPSGGSFAVKTRTSLTWAKGNSCRVRVTTGVEWSKSSFLKGVIERSCLDGQRTYHADLEKAMRTYIQQHESEFVSEGQDASESAEILSHSVAADHSHQRGSSSDDAGSLDAATPAANRRSAGSTLDSFLDLVRETSPINMALVVLIAALVLSNLWTLSSRSPSSPSKPSSSSSRSKGRRESASRTPDEVASAVRGVLQDYFASSGMAGEMAGGRAHGRAAVAPESVDDMREQARQISGALDELESRIATLRKALSDLD